MHVDIPLRAFNWIGRSRGLLNYQVTEMWEGIVTALLDTIHFGQIDPWLEIVHTIFSMFTIT